ncbi:MAG: polysaccharide deacetylase family protein [Myxococcales bacterium]|nr:polysaccharide deacetylase family protein [Myxococcales bacterium]
MTQKWCHITCDVDTIDRHLQGYGVEDRPPCYLVYERAIPRLLEVADLTGVKMTFFLMGRDAMIQRGLLRQIVVRGHEVASHSYSHPQPFANLTKTELTYELGASKASLSNACEDAVVGFRAPAWDVDLATLTAIRAAGYLYDASWVPSPFILATRLAVYRHSTGKRHGIDMAVLPHLIASPSRRVGRYPSTPERGGSAKTDLLTEIPMSVAPITRFPYYHSLSYMVPKSVFDLVYRSIRLARNELVYTLHGVDGLGLHEDLVDVRMQHHPGMDVSLDEKLSRLTKLFRQFAKDYDCIPVKASLNSRQPA